MPGRACRCTAIRSHTGGTGAVAGCRQARAGAAQWRRVSESGHFLAEWAAMEAAGRVLERADELAACTAEPGRITRPVATPAMAGALARVREWMEAAGLETRGDPLGNLAGRRGGDRPLVIGSHLDSVADAGRYDGVLGVLVGIEVAAA